METAGSRAARGIAAVALTAAGLVAAAAVASAQGPPMTAAGAWAATQRAATAAPEEQPPIVTVGPDGLTVKSADGAFGFRLNGYIQTDGRIFVVEQAIVNNDTFLIRRARPIVEGTLYGRFDFRLMPDFGQGQAVLYDAYVDLRFVPELTLRAGKFKPPIGLERLQSARDLTFVERGMPSQLVPTRDVGFMLSGAAAASRLSYAVALMNGVPDHTIVDVSDHRGKEVAGRVFVRPFAASRESRQDLGFGVAGSRGTLTATTASDLPAYRTDAQQACFKYRPDVLADGRHYRLAGQGYYYRGRFGVLAEQVFSSQRVRRVDATGELRSNAWQIAPLVVVTGERASYQGVTPAHPFDPSRGQWGAVAVGVRYSQLVVGDGVFPVFVGPSDSPRAMREVGAGANWYLNRNVKVMTDCERTRLDFLDGTRRREIAVLVRLQVAF